jgi:hypothetical protein
MARRAAAIVIPPVDDEPFRDLRTGTLSFNDATATYLQKYSVGTMEELCQISFDQYNAFSKTFI